MAEHGVIEPIFYQILEYVVAPIGLMAMTSFIKRSRENAPHGREDNKQEYLLIISYSCILFFLGQLAHTELTFGIVQKLATLMLAIGGFILILIYKAFSTEVNNIYKFIFDAFFSWLVGAIFFAVICIIVSTNMCVCHYELDIWSRPAWHLFFHECKEFLCNPLNLIFIVISIFTYLFWKIAGRMNKANMELSYDAKQEYFDLKEEDMFGRFLYMLTLYILDQTPYSKITVCSNLYNYYWRKHKYAKALWFCNKVINTASENYDSEDQIVPHRISKVELCLKLSRRRQACEQRLIIEKLKIHPGEYDPQTVDVWLKKVDAIFESNDIAKPYCPEPAKKG